MDETISSFTKREETFYELLEACKDAEKALERVGAFNNDQYSWLKTQLDNAITKAERGQSKPKG